MSALWTCPDCARVFRKPKQVHSCGTGERVTMLAKRAPELIALYGALEKDVKKWRGVEIVYKRSYALFRTTHVFADLVFMKDCLRLALVLAEADDSPIFFKTGKMSANRYGAVTKLRTTAELKKALPFLKQAYAYAAGE